MEFFKKKEAPAKFSPTEFVISLVEKAFQEGASDIHIESLKNEARIRFRVNGDLQDIQTLPLEHIAQITNALKVLSNLPYQTAELPEDGHFTAHIIDNNNIFKEIDVRLSSFPTINGDAIVLRILNQSEVLLSMPELGMNEDNLLKLKRLSVKSYGMILVNGPVGSGKTTTMYSIIMELSKQQDGKNIITLEDPVEYNFETIRQSQIKPQIGFTFAEGMKSILRQDPDVIMIGEIRDGETASHAVEAALAGRSVFSTIHANSAVGTIARLLDLGVERGMICYALNGTIAQRLIKQVCPDCRQSYVPDPEYIKMLGLENESIDYQHGVGCDKCLGTGFKGRVALFEILEFSDELRTLLIEKASYDDLIATAKKSGFRTLREDAIDKIRSGTTTVEEVVKIVL